MGPVAVMRQAFQKKEDCGLFSGDHYACSIQAGEKACTEQKGAFVKHEEIIATQVSCP